MFIKATEFHNLVQGKMSVVEYTHKFNELAQYAPNEVATDEAKKVRYEHGLTPVMQEKLCNVPTPAFNEMVSATIKAKTKKNVVDNDNHKRGPYNTGYGQGSSSQKTTQVPPRIPGYVAPHPMWIQPCARPQRQPMQKEKDK